MSVQMVQISEELWVNVGDGNIDYVEPSRNSQAEGRWVIWFNHSRTGVVIPELLPIAVIIARLNGVRTTDMGGMPWCNGFLTEGAIVHESCAVEGVHTSHGYGIDGKG